MVSVSLYCASRLVAARLWDRKNHTDINISHVLMGVGMAGMLVPERNLISSEWGEYIFGFAALWFFGRSVQFIWRHGLSGTDEDGVHNLSHYAIHLLMSGAMLYMYMVAPPGGVAERGPAMAMGGGKSR